MLVEFGEVMRLKIFRRYTYALNLLNSDKSFKAGIHRKQKRAGRSESDLAQDLTGQGAS